MGRNGWSAREGQRQQHYAASEGGETITSFGRERQREREREREETERLNERKHLSTNELPFFFQIVNMFLVEKKILSFTEKLI